MDNIQQIKNFTEKVVHYDANTLLVKENELSRKMFIILKGKVKVFTTYMNEKVTLAILGRGEVFGELSFFDAKPRSASVEAISSLTAIVLDSEKSLQEIYSLPEWILTIFKTVFHRLRLADAKITMLQGVNEMQKKHFECDNMAKMIYLELLRFIKTTKIILKMNQEETKGPLTGEIFQNELKNILGQFNLGLKTLWRQLEEYHFISERPSDKDSSQKVTVLNVEAFDKFNDYLTTELKSERFLILSHTALAILRKLIAHDRGAENDDKSVSVKDFVIKTNDLHLFQITFYQEGLNELQEMGIIKVENEVVKGNRVLVRDMFVYQNILKAFDHTLITID